MLNGSDVISSDNNMEADGRIHESHEKRCFTYVGRQNVYSKIKVIIWLISEKFSK